MQDLTIPGVPYSLHHDAWWLSEMTGDEAPPSRLRPPPPPESPATPALHNLATLALVLLVGLADMLFWRQSIGLSLAIFAAAVMAAVWLIARPVRPPGGRLVALIIATLTLLPVIEQVQTLSLALLVTGMLTFAVFATHGLRPPFAKLVSASMRLVTYLPWFAAWSLKQTGEFLLTDTTAKSRFERAKTAWAMPLGVGLLFIWLLTAANPVIEAWFRRAFAGPWLEHNARIRVYFWLAIAYPLWPYLSAPRIIAAMPRSQLGPLPMRIPTPAGVNLFSVANALLLFNLIFAVQTVLDATFLWGGAQLPPGMTHAQYAHRGAYPLVVTAILAGVFALISRPFTNGNPGLRWLLTLWISQNILLVFSSLYRLDLYVDTYGLTHLRIAAAIWMGLVATGLLLVAWQLWRGHTISWLLGRCAAVALLTLYACTFVNFARVIAQTNLQLFTQGSTAEIDIPYLCDLDAAAAGAIREFGTETIRDLCGDQPAFQGPFITGWRDWGFRSWRVRRYLNASPTAVTP